VRGFSPCTSVKMDSVSPLPASTHDAGIRWCSASAGAAAGIQRQGSAPPGQDYR
jgi:hypothetical protein